MLKNKIKKDRVDIKIGDMIAMFEVIDLDEKNHRFIIRCICGEILSRNMSKLRGGQIPRCKCVKTTQEVVVGMRIGICTVIDNYIFMDNSKVIHCKLKCDYGNELVRTKKSISERHIPECDCTPRYNDITGLIFGYVKVIGISKREVYGKKKIYSRILWNYECLKCGKIKETSASNLKRGVIVTCDSKECKLRGENHPLWKFEMDRSARNSKQDLEWSKNILLRDNYTCLCCGKTDSKIEAHHLNGWHWCKDERLLLDNGVSLCKGKLSGCHYEFHELYGRKYNTKQQFEEFLFNKCGKNLDEILQRKGDSQ